LIRRVTEILLAKGIDIGAATSMVQLVPNAAAALPTPRR